MNIFKLLAIIGLSVVILAACSQEPDTIDVESSQESNIEESEIVEESLPVEETTDSEEEVPLSIGVNEEALITDSDNNPVYSIKIIKATNNLSETEDYYTNGKPENTIEVTYEYKNYSYGSLIQVDSQFLSVYDADGLAGTNVGMQNGQTDVPDGKTATATTWFVMSEPVTELDSVEIVYGGDFVLGFEDYVTFEIPLE